MNSTTIEYYNGALPEVELVDESKFSLKPPPARVPAHVHVPLDLDLHVLGVLSTVEYSCTAVSRTYAASSKYHLGIFCVLDLDL